MQRSDFKFDLPSNLIAQHPRWERTHARLLNVLGENHFGNHYFYDLPQFLKAGDVLVMNNARVINARFFGKKETGGKIEVVFDHIQNSQTASVQIRSSKAPKPQTHIFLNGCATAIQVVGRENESLFVLQIPPDANWWEICEEYGALPLPPYIARCASSNDHAQYQTVYAQKPGAVAAPTAGLHFDKALLNTLKTKGVEICFVTLFVGAGTYQPVRCENLKDHKMHRESFEIPKETACAILNAQKEKRRIVAVGTTTLRALEASALKNGCVKAGSDSTDIFLYPGAQFHVVDALITNFHLPCSTLLMLVSAFAGFQTIKKAYAYAIAQRYRFFSYGDAMFLKKSTVNSSFFEKNCRLPWGK